MHIFEKSWYAAPLSGRVPRNPRCVEPNAASKVFFTQGDREVYLRLVRDDLGDSEVRVLAYCLMTNHVHWVVVPGQQRFGRRWRRRGRPPGEVAGKQIMGTERSGAVSRS